MDPERGDLGSEGVGSGHKAREGPQDGGEQSHGGGPRMLLQLLRRVTQQRCVLRVAGAVLGLRSGCFSTRWYQSRLFTCRGRGVQVGADCC